MAGERSDGVLAGGSDGGVRVAEPLRDVAEHFGEMRRQRITVGFGEDGDEVDALLANRRLVGGVGGLDAGKEKGYGAQFEGPGDGLELRSCERVSVAVGELRQAREDPVLEVLRGRHCAVLWWMGRVFSVISGRVYGSRGGASGLSSNIAGVDGGDLACVRLVGVNRELFSSLSAF